MSIPTEPGLYVGYYNKPPTERSVTETPFPHTPIAVLLRISGSAPWLKCHIQPFDFTDSRNIPLEVNPHSANLIFGPKVELPEFPDNPLLTHKEASEPPRTAYEQASDMARSRL